MTENEVMIFLCVCGSLAVFSQLCLFIYFDYSDNRRNKRQIHLENERLRETPFKVIICFKGIRSNVQMYFPDLHQCQEYVSAKLIEYKNEALFITAFGHNKMLVKIYPGVTYINEHFIWTLGPKRFIWRNELYNFVKHNIQSNRIKLILHVLKSLPWDLNEYILNLTND